MISRTFLRSFLLLVLSTSALHADTFGSGANSFTIDFVTIGSPGNPADTTGDPNPAGAVPYSYRIGKYEVPEDAVRKANTLSSLAGAPLGITLDSRGLNKPATSVSWFEAAKFVNWLNTSSGATPAYKFDSEGNFQLWAAGDPGYDPANLFRNTLARYFLPSADEWYKAAFYDPTTGGYWDYPTGSDSPPIAIASGTAQGTAVWNQIGPTDTNQAGGLSPFSTMGQGGNVAEWEESDEDRVNDSLTFIRGVRGSDWSSSIIALSISSSFRGLGSATAQPYNVGFRVAAIVPEPNGLLVAAAILVFLVRWGSCQSKTELNRGSPS